MDWESQESEIAKSMRRSGTLMITMTMATTMIASDNRKGND